MRPNEEDRLYGLISLTARTTIKYQGGVFSPDLIDDAAQDGLGAMIDACPQIAKMPDAERLGMVVALIRDATLRRMQDANTGYGEAQTAKATAADLSEELSAPEIDAWLDALPARQRALALSLYASDATHDEITDAVGLPPDGLTGAARCQRRPPELLPRRLGGCGAAADTAGPADGIPRGATAGGCIAGAARDRRGKRPGHRHQPRHLRRVVVAGDGDRSWRRPHARPRLAGSARTRRARDAAA